MKTKCPAGCGKLFVSSEFAIAHADAAHPEWRNPKHKGWATPYGFADFREPVTYEYACSQMKTLTEQMEAKWNPK